jgi:hypothetical protein
MFALCRSDSSAFSWSLVSERATVFEHFFFDAANFKFSFVFSF